MSVINYALIAILAIMLLIWLVMSCRVKYLTAQKNRLLKEKERLENANSEPINAPTNFS